VSFFNHIKRNGILESFVSCAAHPSATPLIRTVPVVVIHAAPPNGGEAKDGAGGNKEGKTRRPTL
jgi:hypothetical protein